MAHRSATSCQPASNLHPLSRSFLHPECLSPASRPVTRVPRNTRPGPDGPEVGQSRSQGRGPGGCQGSRATGAPARPSQLEEGVQAGMRKLCVPRPGGKPRNLSMRLSQEDPQPKLIPVPARFPGPGTSAASPPRPPHPGSRAGGSAAESEPEPTTQRARAGRALRACPWGRDGPRPHLLRILVGPVPPPPPSACPCSPACGLGAGAALGSAGRCYPPRASVRRRLPGCQSVPRRRSVQARSSLWALGPAHPPPLGRRPPRGLSGHRSRQGPWRDAPPRQGPGCVPFPGRLRTALAFVDGRNDGRPEGWWPQIH